MKNAYLSICSACNEHCKYCPCSAKERDAHTTTPYADLLQKISQLTALGVTEITISGGEPTLHPRLVDLIADLQDRHMKVTLLSNGERFSCEEFREQFLERVDLGKFRLITTIHSHLASEHELANGTRGSFSRTVDGLIALEHANVKITIKHCITKSNYRDLIDFIAFVDHQFLPSADIQLCSIDYCGIPEGKIEQECLPFQAVRPELERAFDWYEAHVRERRLYCINIPLCSCDPYYWKYLPRRVEKMYEVYSDTNSSSFISGHNNVSISDSLCEGCRVKSICCGTYLTAFQYFGDKIIQPIV